MVSVRPDRHAAASRAAYIPLSAATGRGWAGLSGLAVASTVTVVQRVLLVRSQAQAPV